ncbi:MAG: hypothetical protein ACJAZM_003089 [Cyclobacteriaceae bacterium]|jgi:hypothetical protein
MKIKHIIPAFFIVLLACEDDIKIIPVEQKIIASSLFDSCPNSVDSTTGNYDQVNPAEAGNKWWILSRQYSSCDGERGIFLFNETTSKIEVKIDLPNELMSPHGLDYSDGFLWLLGFDDKEMAYRINPSNGEIEEIFTNVTGEGISVVGDSIFIANGASIDLISRSNASIINTFHVNSNTIQDMTVIGHDIFYVVNGEIDPILKLNMVTSKIDTIALTGITALYTLAFRDDYFFAVDGYSIVKIDSINSNISTVATPNINGWLTSIRPN